MMYAKIHSVAENGDPKCWNPPHACGNSPVGFRDKRRPGSLSPMPQKAAPELSVILVVGRIRARGQRVLDALYRQTVADRLELVIVDMAPDGGPPLVPGRGVRATHVSAGAASYVRARILGIEAARAGVIAFIEEH